MMIAAKVLLCVAILYVGSTLSVKIAEALDRWAKRNL